MLRRALLPLSLAALGFGAVFGGAASAQPGTGSVRVADPPAQPTTATAPTSTPPVVPSSESVSAAPSTVVISGHGWGHGIGLAQWGTLGFARAGWTYDRILRHYYRGTTIAKQPSRTLRVLLLEGAKRVTLASESPWSVTDALGTKVTLEPGRLALGPGLAVAGRKLTSPLAFNPGKSPLLAAGKQYRGRLQVLSDGKLLQVVNLLALEAYLKGVVGDEMPTSWPAEALKAQAVAARSYALAGLATVSTARAYDLFSDVRSQVYGGIEGEAPAVTAAVDATAGQVVTYGGKVVSTLYSASSGGRTASAAEAFGKPVPYLVSVADPHDTLSPYHDWGPVLFDARKIAKAMKVAGGLVDLEATRGGSGHVTTVTAVGPTASVSATGSSIRTLLGLRSTWFSVGWLSLEPPGRVAFGASAELDGVARGVGEVSLEGRVKGGSWETVAAVSPDARGAFTVMVKPEATMQYRLAAGDLRAALVTVPVEPAVKATVVAGAVQGTVSPALAGAAVQLQRQSGATWSTVATATTDTAGAFAVATALSPGSYRIRCAPGRGLAPGVSQLLAVP